VVVGDYIRKYFNTNHSTSGNPAARCEPTRFPEVPLAEASEATLIARERLNARETRVETAWLREWRGQAVTDVVLMPFSEDGLALEAHLKRGRALGGGQGIWWSQATRRGELLAGARWPEGLGAFLVRSCYQTSGNAKHENSVDLE
jgi:hypothetical protein